MIENLVSYDSDHLEALLACNGVDNHVAMDADEMLAVENAVFVLASSVDDLGSEFLIVVFDDAGEGVLDCRVVGLDEDAVDEADSERGLACSRVSVTEC